MKNGIYIENIIFYGKHWDNCKIHYKDDKVFCIEFSDNEIRYFKPEKPLFKDMKYLTLHRLDGPAIIRLNKEKSWWINGNCISYSEEEFKEHLRREELRAFE